MSTNDTLYMRRPASWPKDMARDGLPLGNGRTGALVQGGAGIEEILFNRYDVWNGWSYSGLPDVSDALGEMRSLIDQGDYVSANDKMWERLRDAGYDCKAGWPMILGCMKIQMDTEESFSHYRRNLYMDKAECEVTYFQKTRQVRRRSFVSRKDDTFYFEYQANEDTRVKITFDIYNDGTPNYQKVREEVLSNLKKQCCGNGIDFVVKTAQMSYAVQVRVYGAEVKAEGEALTLCGKNFRIAVRCSSGRRFRNAPADFDYDQKLKEHLPRHKRLYKTADIRLGRGKKRTNEELLDEVYEDQASPELIEKMWRFGRYIFVCGTCEGGLPIPLYGLWQTKYDAMWCQNVANENVQIIYWHTAVGGLTKLVRPLIDYFYSAMDIYRENAQKLFGCKGIFIGGYSTPANRHMSVFVPVILNFTGVAGWLAQHFYKYYRMTNDRKLLDEKIFPFMLAAADFYLDYLAYDENGKIVYYPCVSPENTPGNLVNAINHIPDRLTRHRNPVTKNAVMEVAIVKELFTNLVVLIQETGENAEYLPQLQKALADMPEYQINGDGALKEWITPELEDNYFHRHLSHIYPLFPGDEVVKEENPELYAAIERAVDLRQLGAQCGWSVVHMASIYATMGRGESVMQCLDTMLKGYMINNFMSNCSDYRNMGLSAMFEDVVVQIDANMGFVNAVQKMIFDERRDYLLLLPAISERLAVGSASNFCFSGGKVSLKWDLKAHKLQAKIVFERECSVQVRLPEGFSAEICNERIYGQKGTVVEINCD